jgi:hypothetical protein
VLLPGASETSRRDSIETPDARWTFALPQKFLQFTFAEGTATAHAVAVFEDESGNQRAFTWSETVQLTHAKIPPPSP